MMQLQSLTSKGLVISAVAGGAEIDVAGSLFCFLFAPKPKAQGIALIKGTSLTYPDGLELSDQTQWHRFDMRAASKHRPVAPLMNCYNMVMFCKQ